MAPRNSEHRVPRRFRRDFGTVQRESFRLSPLVVVAVLFSMLVSGCGSSASDDGIVANAAMPGYLQDFVANDGLLMVPQLRREAADNAAVAPSFAGDVRATYLYVMIETLIGRPFVDADLAAAVQTYRLSANASVGNWEKALQDRISGRLKGRVAITAHPSLTWVPELGGDGGRYLPDMALLCLDLEVDPGTLKPVDRTGPGPRAHAVVANWVITGKKPTVRDDDAAAWHTIVLAGPGRSYREYVLAATALLLSASPADRPGVIDEVGAQIDKDRGVDGVPWMLPGAKGDAGGDLLTSLAGIYFDLAASDTTVEAVLRGRTAYTTYLGTHL